MPFLIVIVVLAVVLVVSNVRIVPQASCFVLERLGEYVGSWSAGLHVKVPFIDRVVKKVSLKEQVLDFPPQPVITKDNVTMSIDSVVYAHVFDPYKYTYGVENPLMGLQNLTATTLRSVIGDMELDETLSSRAEINTRMQVILDEATDNWGLKVTRVEIKNIQPPKEIEEVMTTQMRAERERRQTLLEAQAHKEAVVARAEGDKQAKLLAAQAESEARELLAAGQAKALEITSEAEAAALKRLTDANMSPAVLQLKGIQAMKDVADGQATKIFIPSDLASSLGQYGLMGEMFGTAGQPSPAVPREQMRREVVRKATQAVLGEDGCAKPGMTDESRSAAVSATRSAVSSAMRDRSGQSVTTSKYLSQK